MNKRDADHARVLSAGLTEGVQGFTPLPYVATELQTLDGLYRSRLLLNQAFLTSNLENEMKEHPYSIVHIATHGKFEKRVEDTFLLTFDDKLTMNELAHALGLAGVAIKAGASSALATLWFISDQASSMLVSEFYRQLHDRPVSKAVALQQAQLKMLGDPVYDHPAYWAPFLLLNNWL